MSRKYRIAVHGRKATHVEHIDAPNVHEAIELTRRLSGFPHIRQVDVHQFIECEHCHGLGWYELSLDVEQS